MRSYPFLLNRRRVAAIATSLGGLTLMVGLTAAVARNDDGAKTFFLERAPGASVVRQVAAKVAWVRSLTIAARPHRQQVASSRHRHVTVARAPRSQPRAPVETAAADAVVPVTMYTDRTLQPGDAVMTAAGIRIFRGAQSFPYRDADFVALTRAAGLSRSVTRTLASLNTLAGG